MKTSPLLLSLLALLLGTLAIAQADDYTPLPFPVSIGGQAAQVKGEAAQATHATIARPVATNAALEVGAKEMIIVNVVTANEKGVPTEGATPAVIIIQKGGKTTLDQTMDGKKLAPGDYTMAIVAEGKTATVLVKIE
ncbi:MAG TPA: hypothetical protein VK474_07405 [Chthoniobacterales bacterium]|nr:hypothetical protein [Chthoniobacterales bacterium]